MDDREIQIDGQAGEAVANSIGALGAGTNLAESSATINESEASKLTGLSGPTLRQLVEVGSIDGERSDDGSYSFEFRSLRALVPLDDREAMGASYESRRGAGARFEAAALSGVRLEDPSGLELAGDEQEAVEVDPDFEEATDVTDTTEVAAEKMEAVESQGNAPSFQQAEDQTPETADTEAQGAKTQGTNGQSQNQNHRSADQIDLEARLLKVLRWQDNIIAVKDEQIAALQSEINWLRLRVEKFEDQSDRDRVLLMSQNQTIQQLAKLDRNKRSLMRSTMEFLGLVPKEEIRTLE